LDQRGAGLRGGHGRVMPRAASRLRQ
jgi:hypothetical protein